MSNYTINGHNIMLAAIRGEVSAISLHSDDPGDSGDNEIADSGYERWSVSAGDFSDVEDGEFSTLEEHEFSTSPEQTVSHAGIWSGEDFLGSSAITGAGASSESGRYFLTSVVFGFTSSAE